MTDKFSQTDFVTQKNREFFVEFLENLSDFDIIKYCVSLLNEKIPELDEEIAPKVNFAAEQLKLAITPLRARRYSPTILTTTVLWKMTSSALYKQVHKEGILTIPAPNYLDRLTKPFTAETGFPESTKKYLRARFSRLSDREKIVNLILDEVYSSQRVEYSGGTFYGFENNKVTF